MATKLNTQRLLNAVRAVYYSAHWTPDRDVDAGALWTELRDAAGFEEGKAPTPEDIETAAIKSGDIDNFDDQAEGFRGCCNANHPDTGTWCTRSPRHTGEHIAGDGLQVVDRWASK